MKLGKTLYVSNRHDWRNWLEKNHDIEPEIWLIYYKKHTKTPRIPYNHAVEEALCFGWIDSTVKKIDDARYAQRFTPRRKNSKLSAMNLERIRRLIATEKMTPAGLQAVQHLLPDDLDHDPVIAPDILDTLQQDPQIWKHFQAFPRSYQRIRIGWIEMARSRPEVFKKRLEYFLTKTRKNQKYGMVQ